MDPHSSLPNLKFRLRIRIRIRLKFTLRINTAPALIHVGEPGWWFLLGTLDGVVACGYAISVYQLFAIGVSVHNLKGPVRPLVTPQAEPMARLYRNDTGLCRGPNALMMLGRTLGKPLSTLLLASRHSRLFSLQFSVSCSTLGAG